jgi:murein endopeptidase
MLQPIQSTKSQNYYKIPQSALGVAPAPWRVGAGRIWGRKSTIEFLINLGWWWDFSWNPYDKFVQSTIYLGDISPEGGAGSSDPVKDHSTHKSGHDVDIFFVRNDGKPERTSCLQTDTATYDLEQTIKLGKLIVHIAERLGLIIGFYYCSDANVRKEVPRATDFTNHHDHFHVNIVHPSEAPKNYRR